jgi:hypothetical protein
MARTSINLEQGIFVYIDLDELSKLEEKDGYLPRDAYIPSHKEMARENEVGRFLFFRFLYDEEKAAREILEGTYWSSP